MFEQKEGGKNRKKDQIEILKNKVTDFRTHKIYYLSCLKNCE